MKWCSNGSRGYSSFTEMISRVDVGENSLLSSKARRERASTDPVPIWSSRNDDDEGISSKADCLLEGVGLRRPRQALYFNECSYSKTLFETGISSESWGESTERVKLR